MCSGWQPKQPLRPNYSLLHTKFPLHHSDHATQQLFTRATRHKSKAKEASGGTEGAATGRHILHNKSKAISCIPALAIPTRGSGILEMHGNLRNEEEREHFPSDAIKPTNQG